MRFVFDTNVLLSSTLWYGSVSKRLLNKIVACDHELFSSASIISEYQKVLRRDFGFDIEEIKRITNIVFSLINLVEPEEKLDIVKEDLDDNKILECAVASSADFIITYDKHLLRLKEFSKIKIITPEETIKII